MVLLYYLTFVLGVAIQTTHAAFGVTNSGGYYTIDTGAANSFVFKVNQANCDITSLFYRGIEYQYASQKSHIGSGLGSAKVSATTINDQFIKITCVSGTLTQYYIAKSGDSTIYMGTYITAQPSIGELRYIARLNKSLLNPGNAYETSSGGPFFRDINRDRNSGFHAFTFYMNSGHAQTEARRIGFNGPYALVFSRSGIPSKNLDLSFFSQLSLTGYVPDSGRGAVSGTAFGVSNSFQRVVHWYNSAAQYWTYTNSNGVFTSPRMKPGTYTMVLYKDEFSVAKQTVTVSAGSTVKSDINSAEDTKTPLWIIGTFDGQPEGFQNADLQEHMHPSDIRMTAWTPKTFTVGSSALSTFPMAQIKSVNNPTTIKFTLSSAPGAGTLKIGTTLSFAGGRPQVTVNSWTGPAPSAPTSLDSRGFTRGTYRGLGEVYTVSIPSGVLKSGDNTIQINTISGQSDNGFLSPNFIYDAVALYKA
ncbi:hypothetical protein FRC03_002266 [Tulasnella sp. 419]|nr:hypothetical protein FRC03_002266 [Tulasnella sp. 419]